MISARTEQDARVPQVSIVIPTCNGSSRLEGVIRALEVQTDAPPFEVIVVDDGSTDDTWVELERLKSSSSLDLRPIRLDRNLGPSAARNQGWRAARTSAIVFTDDDCTPQPGWLGAIARRLEHSDIVQGFTMPDPRKSEERGVFSHTVVVGAEWGFYETCNIAYDRNVLEKVGGFDESFDEGRDCGRAPFGEDADLAWRAKSMGARSSFEPDAVVWHDVQPGSLARRLRELPRKEGSLIALRRHPILRRSFPGGRWFAYPSHPRVLVLVFGLVWAAIRRTSIDAWLLAFALAVPWVRHRGMNVPKRAWIRELPQALVYDLLEIAFYARASIRQRTFLL